MNISRALRIAAAVALLVGAVVHLQLYLLGYRTIDKIGPGFLLNVIVSGLVASALVARDDWFVRLAGIGIAVGTIGAFVLSRRDGGLFDFREQGLNPSPQALIALVVEIAAIALLAASFLPTLADNGEPSSMRSLGLATAMSAVVLGGLGLYWANHYGSTTTTGGGVRISGFAFGPRDLSVTNGTTVTWTNGDAVDHTVVATDTSFISDNLGQAATFEHTFDTPGSYAYVCGIHSQMSGTVTVTG